MLQELVIGPFREQFGIAEDLVVRPVSNGFTRLEIELPNSDVAGFENQAKMVGTSVLEG
jgi:hypothetical protein